MIKRRAKGGNMILECNGATVATRDVGQQVKRAKSVCANPCPACLPTKAGWPDGCVIHGEKSRGRISF